MEVSGFRFQVSDTGFEFPCMKFRQSFLFDYSGPAGGGTET
jgi:hypothetical protein